MTDNSDDQESRWTMPVDEAEAEAWTHQNGTTPHRVAAMPPLEALPIGHEDYLEALLRSVDVHYEDEPPQYRVLFTPIALARLRTIKEEAPDLYDGVFAPWVRARHDLFWPDVDRRIQEGPAQQPLAFVHTPPPLYPPLPEPCLFDEMVSNGASPWLDAYCAYSQQWAPRAAAGFHQAIGLWVLSTVAARRICVELGNQVYPVLFLGLIAESSQYTKTTAAANGHTLLRRAGLQHLLAPDRSTPQALLRSMSGRVPQDYGQKNDEEQEGIQRRVAFAGQRGWYYEEWGGMLHQMTRQDSPMSGFHELLRVLDDGKAEFSSDTIQRGLERIEAPYLALLTSATPQDLAPFMQSGSKWWRDGFWPRFAFIAPEEGPRLDRRPQGLATPSAMLIEQLHSWHVKLGVPTVTMEARVDKKQRPTGEWTATLSPLPCTPLHIPDETLDAYYAYNDALLQMDVTAELRPTYSRFHDKALRIAMLLASLQGHETIPLAHWAYAQEITERWRAMLHRVIATVITYQPLSPDEQHEQRIERMLMQEGPMPVRDVQRRLHLDSGTIKRLIQNMVGAERAQTQKVGKRLCVCLPQDADMPEEYQEGEQEDVPFTV